jgi:hypothetical protein
VSGVPGASPRDAHTEIYRNYFSTCVVTTILTR